MKKRANMLHQGSVILDAKDGQQMPKALESRGLLEIQYVRQGLIRHGDVREYRW